MATPLEDLKKMQNSNHLNIEDWKLLKQIATSKQHSFRPCSCNKPVPLSKIQFTLDSAQNYNSPHPASSLGKIYNRFKCSSHAYGCKQSFSPVAMLTIYQEGMEFLNQPSTQASSLKRSRSLSPPILTQQPSTTATSATSSATSPCMNVTPACDSITSASHIAKRPNPELEPPSSLSQESTISHKLDTLTDLFERSLAQSNDRYERSTYNFEKVISTLENVTEKNLALEKEIQLLTSKLIEIEAKVCTLETTLPATHVIPPALSPSAQAPFRAQNPSDSSLSRPSTTTSIFPAPAESTPTTWAAVAASDNLLRQKAKNSINNEQRVQGITALKTLALTKEKSRTNLTTALYVGGFEFQKLSLIWKALRAARFQISRIVEIQWIGKTVLEIVVASDYHTQFASELIATNSFRILKFDPSSHSKAISTAQSETAMRCFAIRIVKNSLFGRTDASKNHFQRVGREASLKNPQLKAIISEEWNRGLATKNAEIISLETTLQNFQNSSPATDDVIATAERLLALSPGHPLAIQLMDSSLTSAREANETRTSTNSCNISSPPASASTASAQTTDDSIMIADDETNACDPNSFEGKSNNSLPHGAALPAAGHTPARSAGDGERNISPVTSDC